MLTKEFMLLNVIEMCYLGGYDLKQLTFWISLFKFREVLLVEKRALLYCSMILRLGFGQSVGGNCKDKIK